MTVMKKDFIERVKKERIVDTKTYRYVVDEEMGQIKRLPIKNLDTTAAIDGWESVANI